MPPHNSKHMLIKFATNLNTMNKVKANYAWSSSSRSINCAIRGTPRSYDRRLQQSIFEPNFLVPSIMFEYLRVTLDKEESSISSCGYSVL